MKDRDLLDVFKEFEPRLMSNGQIRMECPFTENHLDGSGKMSFFASPDINGYHCFSCRAHGNLVRLLTSKFGVNYFDAMGVVKLTDYMKEEEVPFELDIKWDLTPPKEFLRRGFTKETLKKRMIGSTSDGWIVIPFYMDGELLGYQRRKDYPDRIVINSKGFNKREFLYNLDRDHDYVIVTEGYSDEMRLEQFGYNTTAVLGTNISKWQAKEISKFKKVYLAFDNDSPGRRATELCYQQIKNYTDVRIIPYLTEDPAECTSRREWTKYFNQATDYMEYTLEMTLQLEGYMEMKADILKTLEYGHKGKGRSTK